MTLTITIETVMSLKVLHETAPGVITRTRQLHLTNLKFKWFSLCTNKTNYIDRFLSFYCCFLRLFCLFIYLFYSLSANLPYFTYPHLS